MKARVSTLQYCVQTFRIQLEGSAHMCGAIIVNLPQQSENQYVAVHSSRLVREPARQRAALQA